MKESADKKLREHIISVFDNYDDGGAEHGWLELRKKHPAKPVKRVILWWSSAAAILIAAGALFLFNPFEYNQNTVAVVKTTPRTTTPVNDKKKLPDSATKGSFIPKTSHLSGNKIAASARKQEKPIPEINARIPDAIQKTTTLFTTRESPVVKAGGITPQNDRTYSEPTKDGAGNLEARAQIPLVQANPIDTVSIVAKTNSFNKNQLTEVIAEEKTDLRRKKESHDKKFELTFYAGAFLNYAEGSNNSMNMGAGISSGISVSKRLTIVAGLALAKNTLTFKNELPSTSYLAFVAADKTAAPSFSSSSVPHISQLEATLLNLDIPINIKYSLSRKPNKIFISTGLSSFTYLNEAYRYSYGSFNNLTNTFASSDNKVLSKNFGKFDLAQTLNLSLGLTHAGKAQNIIIEPFIKYPLGTLGSQDIRFGSAGLNLKLSINPGTDQH